MTAERGDWMLAEPGPAELMRGLQALREDVRNLSEKLDEGYVRKDVQDAREVATNVLLQGIDEEQHAINKRIDKIEERLTSHFRFLVTQFVYPLLVGIIVYVILVPHLQK